MASHLKPNHVFILLPSILAIATGAITVLLTSPTLLPFLFSLTSLDTLPPFTPSTLLTTHAIVTDVTFIFLLAFLILCNHEPSSKWIARNQSFPYSYRPTWYFGSRALDFQLLIFEIFHVGRAARWIHCLGIILEEGLWAMIMYLTFGFWGLGALLMVLAVQGFTYGDPWLGVGVLVGNTFMVGGFWWFVDFLLATRFELDYVSALNVVKGLLFWTVTLRTLSHVLEPLPPTYRPEVECFDNNFGVVGWKLCLENFPRALWLVILGNVSEFGAGMPGRLFNVVVYKTMYACGFRSRGWRQVGWIEDGQEREEGHEGLLDVREAKVQAWRVIEYGWMGHDETARMYRWALAGGVGLSEKSVQEDV